MNAVSLFNFFLFILSYAKFSRDFCLFWQSKHHLNTVSQNQRNSSQLISAVNGLLKMGNSRCTEEPQQQTTWLREWNNSLASSAGTQSAGGGMSAPALELQYYWESLHIHNLKYSQLLKKKKTFVTLASWQPHSSLVSWYFRQVWELDGLLSNGIWWATEKCYPKSSKTA